MAAEVSIVNVMALLVMLVANASLSALEPCPIDNSTVCRCVYHDIVCDITNGGLQHQQLHAAALPDVAAADSSLLPKFTEDGVLYRSVDLARLHLRGLPEGSFFHLKVKKITLEFNPIGDRLHVDAFAGVETVLEELSLGHCLLPSLRQGLFIGMRRLKHLHLWSNQLRYIPSGLFLGTQKLEELILWGNKLERLEENMFAGLSRLRRLDLDRNRIKEIRNNTFRHLPRLEVLHIGENDIFTVYGYTFRHLSNLKVLNMDHNGLTYIFPGAFDGLKELLSLGLHSNDIGFIPDGTFKDLSELNVLWLQGNKIELIWAKTFAGLTSLQKLYLNGNRIHNLPEGVFKQSQKLKQLILDNNYLETLRKCILSRRTRLKTLSLVGNPINCDCRLMWLLDLIRRNVSVWGTCVSSKAQNLMAISNAANYRAAGCPFSSADCRFK